MSRFYWVIQQQMNKEDYEDRVHDVLAELPLWFSLWHPILLQNQRQDLFRFYVHWDSGKQAFQDYLVLQNYVLIWQGYSR